MVAPPSQFQVNCPHCEAQHGCGEALIGKVCKCPHCGRAFRVPDKPTAERMISPPPSQPPTRTREPTLAVSAEPRAHRFSWSMLKPIHLLFIGGSGAITMLVLVSAVVVFLFGSQHATTPVSTFADAARRLELRGYRLDSEHTIVDGLIIVTYKKETRHTLYSVDTLRMTDGKSIGNFDFMCHALGTSAKTSRQMWDNIEADVCALVNGRTDFRRARASMKTNEAGRFEGHATTSEGWQITVREERRNVETIPETDYFIVYVYVELKKL